MPKRISADIKKDAIGCCMAGIGYVHTGDYLGVSETSVRRWWLRWNHHVVTVEERGDEWIVVDTEKEKVVSEGHLEKADADMAVYEFL